MKHVKNFRKFRLFETWGTYVERYVDVVEKDMSREEIEAVMLDWYEGSMVTTYFPIGGSYVDLMADETIKLLEAMEYDTLYRGLSGSGEAPEEDNGKDIESWTFDYDTAAAFADRNGKIIERSVEEVKDDILFSMDVFVESISEEFVMFLDPINGTDAHLRDIIENYVSESEIILVNTYKTR